MIATGTNAVAVADAYANQNALPARWRSNAKFAANLGIINAFRQLPQATGLNYSIVSDASSPPKMLGWPVYENNAMDGTLTGATADYGLISGDFNQFAIVDRIGPRSSSSRSWSARTSARPASEASCCTGESVATH